MSGYDVEWKKKEMAIVKDTIVKHKTVAMIPKSITEKLMTEREAKIDPKPCVEYVMVGQKRQGLTIKQNEFIKRFHKTTSVIKTISEDRKTSKLATASMVLGIVSLITYTAAILFAICAVVFAILAIRKIKREGMKGNGMAIAGFICGCIALVVWFMIIMLA